MTAQIETPESDFVITNSLKMTAFDAISYLAKALRAMEIERSIARKEISYLQDRIFAQANELLVTRGRIQNLLIASEERKKS